MVQYECELTKRSGFVSDYFRKIVRKKDQVSFLEIEKLQRALKLNNTNFADFAQVHPATVGLWRRRGLAPASAVSKIREEFARFYKDEFDRKMKLIWSENDEE